MAEDKTDSNLLKTKEEDRMLERKDREEEKDIEIE